MIQIILAIISGLMLTLSFPKPGYELLAWFALIPILFICSNQISFWKLFFLGLLTGLVHYFTLMSWVINSFSILANLPKLHVLSIFLIISIYLSFYPAIFMIIAKKICNKTLSTIILLPVTWVSLEYIRTHCFFCFPWGLIGYTQYQNISIIQIANITGIYGVSYLVVLGNISVFLLIMALSKKKWNDNEVDLVVASGGIFLFITLVCFSFFYGKYCINSFDREVKTYPMKKFAIIQGNIDQSIKWDPDYTRSSEKKYLNLSISQKKYHPDLIIWPETALTFYFQKKGSDSNKIRRFIRLYKTDFLLGSPAYFKDDNENYFFYNRAYLVGKDGITIDKYDKYHLVPFGEYVPLQKVFYFLKKLAEGDKNFSPGDSPKPVKWHEYNIAVQICYEVIFPNLCRRIVTQNSNLIVNVTNDAWFGKTSGPYQHFSMAVFRAIENKRALIRSANTGISGLIDPVGRILYASPIYEDIAKTLKAPLIESFSFYTRFGDLFSFLCIFITGVLVLSKIYHIIPFKSFEMQFLIASQKIIYMKNKERRKL